MKSAIILLILNSILLIPLIGGLLSEEFQWDMGDYVIAGLMLNLLGYVLLIVNRHIDNKNIRYLVLAITIVVFLLIWAELAVGIFK